MIDENVLRVLQAVPVLRGPGGVRYVRASDIPPTARPAFEQWIGGIRSLIVPGEQPGDPVPEEEYREWLRTLAPARTRYIPTLRESEE